MRRSSLHEELPQPLPPRTHPVWLLIQLLSTTTNPLGGLGVVLVVGKGELVEELRALGEGRVVAVRGLGEAEGVSR